MKDFVKMLFNLIESDGVIERKYNEIYKLDSKGKLRVFFIEEKVTPSKTSYRVCTGIYEGKIVKSKWTVAKPKNVGRSNETTSGTQSQKEIQARYEKKLNEGYFDSIEEAKQNPDGMFFKPMLAVEWDKVTDKYKQFPLLIDPKLDGMRMTIDKSLKPISRKGKSILTASHIANDLSKFFEDNPSIVLNGELYTHEIKDDFNTLMSIARQLKPTDEDLKKASEKLQFHIYDMYDYNNPEMTAMERKQWLEMNLPLLYTVKLVSYDVAYNEEQLELLKQENLREGYEGSIARVPTATYKNKRTSELIKIKDFITEEYIVLDILKGKGNKEGIAGSVLVKVGDVEVGCGIRGSWELCNILLKNKEIYIGNIATVRHFGKTPDGSLRFPVVIDFKRPDYE